jgi:hypothetical protein
VPKFANPGEVQNWLVGKASNVASVFAVRAALRVLPGLSQMGGLSEKRSRNPARKKLLQVFRSAVASWTIVAFPAQRDRLREAAVASITGSVTSDIQRAAENAVAAVAGAETDSATLDYALQTIRLAIDAAAATSDRDLQLLLAALSIDADVFDQLFSPTTVAHSKLWPDNLGAWPSAEWTDLKALLLAADEDWDAWAVWYEDRVFGRTANQEIEARRILIPSEVWDAGPSVANREIMQLEAQPADERRYDFLDRLRRLPLDKAAVMGVRQALRVMPLLTLGAGEFKAGFVLALRSVSLAWVSARYPVQVRNLVPIRGLYYTTSKSRIPLVRLIGSAMGASNPGSSAIQDVVNTVAISTLELRTFFERSGGAGASSVFDILLSDDLSDLEGAAASAIAGLSLWPNTLPDWMVRRWDELKKDLLADGNGWEVWINWYEDRLRGITRSEGHEFAYVETPDWMWADGPAQANAWILERIRELEVLSAAKSNIPSIPESGPGPQYQLRNGRLSEETSQPLRDEAQRQLNLHGFLRRDSRKLADTLQQAANRYPELANAAREYSDLYEVEITATDVTGVWSVGSALAAFARSYQEQNASRTMAEPLEPQIDALLHSVVRQHGAFIMGFEEGRDLVHRADEFALDTVRLREIEAPGNSLLTELTLNRALVDERTSDLHHPVRASVIEFGWASSRISYAAYLIVRNGVRAMIKYTVGENPNAGAIIGILTGTSLLLGDTNAEFIRAAVPVLQQYGSQMVAFFNHSPEMRAYVEWALQILDADHDKERA